MIGRLSTAVRRTSAVPVLVRSGVFLAGVAALLLAAPAELRALPAALAGMVTLALLAGLLPGSGWVTALILAAVAGWVAATTGYDEPAGAVRVLVLAGLLYLVHSLAALAAAVPYDAVVGPDVWARWLARTVLVVVVSAVLSVALLLGLARLPAIEVPLAVALGGLALAIGLAVLLSALSRR